MMLEKFTAFADQQGLFKKDDRVLLAVSGGMDSMVMLHLFHKIGLTIRVAHCNFQLRAIESDADEAFVKEYCAQLNVPVYTRRFETNNYATENQLSTQMAARELRYAWFNELMEVEKWDKLATAHHLDDNMETLLLNLVRGTGIDGLKGIPDKRGYLIRPLLHFTREEIKTFAVSEKLMWRDDATNRTSHYDRNFIRHEVLPKLKELNPSLATTFTKNFKRFAGAEEMFRLGLETFQLDAVTERNRQVYINKAKLESLQFSSVTLWELTKAFGFNLDQCEQVIACLSETSGKKFLSPTHQLTVDREYLILSEHKDFWNEVVIQEGTMEANLGPWKLTIEELMDKAYGDGKWEASLDADTINGALTWRQWREGDYFFPLGMEHRKKLSDFFIDNKISLADKNAATVLEADGNIVWVVGYRIDNRFKITDKTQRILHLTLEPYFM